MDILIYSETDLSADPRVHRQIEALKKDHTVIAVGISAPNDASIKYIDISEINAKYMPKYEKLKRLLEYILVLGIRKTGMKIINRIVQGTTLYGIREFVAFQKYSKKMVTKLSKQNKDIIIVNDLSGLSIAFKIRKGNEKVIYDAHEYSPGQYPENQDRSHLNSYAKYLLKKYLHKCSSTMTVGEKIASLYERDFHIKPLVITNAPHFIDQLPIFNTDESFRLVHHGRAGRNRELELMIEAILSCDERFSLDFYLIGNSGYIEELKQRSKGSQRIRFKNPVPMTELPSTLNKYDVGLYLLPPISINQKLALPNKIFEFIQGRLAVAIGPSLEMAEYVKKYEIGIISDGFSSDSMARTLMLLTRERINLYKSNAHRFAYMLSAEPNIEKLRNLVHGYDKMSGNEK